jgi:hypothetical protein
MTAGQVLSGVGLALLGHICLTVIPMLGIFAGLGGGGGLWMWAVLAGQAGLFIACVVSAIVLLTRDRYRGVGLGLLIGWGVGLLLMPVLAFVIAFFGYTWFNT